MISLSEAARPLAPRDRDPFLRAVATELSRYQEIGPGIIGRVVREVQRRHFDPPEFYGGRFVVERRKPT